jgi:hypothetical protein
VSQDVGFVWSAATATDLDAPPTAEFDMRPVVQRYFPSLAYDRLRSQEFEQLVFDWIGKLSDPGADIDITREPEATLKRIGLLDAMRDAVATTARVVA